MRIIYITPGKTKPLVFDKKTNAFYGNEKDIPFSIVYQIINIISKNSEVFKLSYSTGPEFDPETKWIYKSTTSEIQLVICNDFKITTRNEESYLRHKSGH